MRVRAFTALTVAAVALAIACSDADTPGTGGGTGGGYAYSGATGGATSATGGGTGVAPGTGGENGMAVSTGGASALGTGGAGTATGGTPGVTPATGGTPGVTPSTGGTTTIPDATGGTTTSTNTGGTTTSVNTGGTTNTGGTDAGDPPVDGNDYSVGEGAFVESCGWSGFAWTGADTLSTIDPADFEGAAADAALCANGSVSKAEDWSGYAMLAINIGQGADDDDSADITPDGTGIYVDIENTAGSPLRIQIQDSTGGDDATHRWCANYTSPGVIPWSDFNTKCWDSSEGTAYNGEEINAVMVLVPGDDDTDTAFDFCVNKIEPEGSASCTGDSTPENTGGAGNTENTGGTGNTGGNNTGGTEDSTCTDDPNPEQPETSCQQWKDWNNCDQSWMVEGHICDRTCGRCSGNGNGNTGGGGNTNTGGNGQTGETLPPLQNGTNGFATRYWDCCKPSCGWTANASNPVDSCNISDQNIGVNDNDRNGCEGGTAFTCHSWAPWAVSDTLSYGFAAFNGANCGTCYQIQFSGSSSRGTATPGIAGKQMVVQVTNIGGIEQNQFDILIPGGGVGAMNGCSTQWGASDLGVQYGGWRSSCGADAGCIRSKCEAAFGNDAKLMAGCEWYITWFQMADNPDITYAPIACPSAITAVSGG